MWRVGAFSHVRLSVFTVSSPLSTYHLFNICDLLMLRHYNAAPVYRYCPRSRPRLTRNRSAASTLLSAVVVTPCDSSCRTPRLDSTLGGSIRRIRGGSYG